MSNVVCYLCVVRLDGAERVLLWGTDEIGADRIAVDPEGVLLVFPSERAARDVGAIEGWSISPEQAASYDFDEIERWCRSDDGIADCAPLLNAWNLLVDLPEGEGLFRAADARAIAVYDKLFRGCNLPAMMTGEERYVPVWANSEITALKHLLLLGLAELRARLPKSHSRRHQSR